MTGLNNEARRVELVRGIARLQDALDDALRDLSLAHLVPTELIGASGNAIGGAALARYLLPFVTMCDGVEAPGLAPVDRVLGLTSTWRRRYQPARSEEEMVRYFADPDRARREDKDCARLTRIEPFGLYVAHEGKNRVRFLRDQGATHMAALIDVTHYPAPARLRLYRAGALRAGGVWAVLDDRFLQPIDMPSLTVPLLQAYGVASPQNWPANEPRWTSVCEALNKAWAGGSGRRHVDLNPLRREDDRVATGEGFIPCSILHLQEVHPRWQWWIALLAALLATSAIEWVLPAGGGVWLGISAGVVIGAFLTVTGNGFVAQQKALPPLRQIIRDDDEGDGISRPQEEDRSRGRAQKNTSMD